MAKVALIQIEDYDPEKLYLAFQAAFADLDLKKSFQPGEKILIKPNLLAAVPPEKAVTPHPAVFTALARCLQNLGLALSYGDSPAVDNPDRAARNSGIAAAAAELDIPGADFDNSTEVELPQAKVMRRTNLAQGVIAADGLVTLAKLKTHALTGMTGAVKNQFGTIPGLRKAKLHVSYQDLDNFALMLADLNCYLKPRLAVMDAVVAMQGNGPKNGEPRKVGAILLSTDLLACDLVGAYLMNLPAKQMRVLQKLQETELATGSLANIDACRISIAGRATAISSGKAASLFADLVVNDFIHAETERSTLKRATSLGAPFLKRYVMNRPVINEKLCTRCGICVKACPVEPKALQQKSRDDVPVYNYTRCIRCYCCQETCPTGAIFVRKSLLGRLLHP